MPRAENRFVCQQCGAVHPKWSGKCDACGGWNTLIEETVRTLPKGLGGARGKLAFVGLDGASQEAPRRLSGIAEFDRVCGGGLVPGSALLVGGDPGIGKSTLLLQAAAALSQGRGGAVLESAYISG
ncbi:MAG: DNA repair protein RadA, partial [Stellaceae bacterium]